MENETVTIKALARDLAKGKEAFEKAEAKILEAWRNGKDIEGMLRKAADRGLKFPEGIEARIREVTAQLLRTTSEPAVMSIFNSSDDSAVHSYPTSTAMEKKGGSYTIELDREIDGRWIADIPQLPGVMVYGASQEEALSAVKALALRVLADRLEHGEGLFGDTVSFALAVAA